MTIEQTPTTIGGKFVDEIVAARAHDLLVQLFCTGRAARRINFQAWTFADELPEFKNLSMVCSLTRLPGCAHNCNTPNRGSGLSCAQSSQGTVPTLKLCGCHACIPPQLSVQAVVFQKASHTHSSTYLWHAMRMLSIERHPLNQYLDRTLTSTPSR